MKLFKAFGTQVSLDKSWFMFVGILTALECVFGGPVAALGTMIVLFVLFASVIAHEFAHIAAGRTVGIHVPRVVLYMFGGAALFPVIPFGLVEVWIAVVGPLFSLAVGSFCKYVLVPMTVSSTIPVVVLASDLFNTLGWINLALGLFNLLPIFPMDGGRMVRGLLFMLSKKPVWSTKMVVYGGWALAPVVVYYVNGGLWMIIIFALIMFMGFSELQSIQKKYNK